MAELYQNLSLVRNSLIRIFVQQFQQQEPTFSCLAFFLFCFVSVRLEFSAPGMQVNTMCLSLARNYSLIYLGLLTFFFCLTSSSSLKQTPLESGRRLDVVFFFFFCLNAYPEIIHIYCESQMYSYAEKRKGRMSRRH